MNRRQSETYSMLCRMLVFFHKNAAYFNRIPVMNELIVKIGNLLTQIDELRGQQSVDITGLSIQKARLRTVACQKALEVSHAVLAYAKISDNRLLMAEVGYTETELKRYSDNELLPVLSIIYKAAIKNKAELGGYGLDNERIANLKLAIDAYDSAIPSPKGANILRKQITYSLAILFNENALLMEQIDLLMDTLKYTNSRLFSEYEDYRRVQKHIRSLKAKVLVTDSLTGVGVPRVKVVFTLDGVSKLDRITAVGGGLLIKSLPAGVYTVSFSKTGYKSQVLEVNLIENKLCTIEVAMEKL